MTIALTFFNFSQIILDIHMEGRVSQVFDIDSRFYFMKCRKLVFNKYKKVPVRG